MLLESIFGKQDSMMNTIRFFRNLITLLCRRGGADHSQRAQRQRRNRFVAMEADAGTFSFI